jgi:hypothetical protein
MFLQTLVGLSSYTSPHGVTTQKINIDIFTAVRTSHLTLESVECQGPKVCHVTDIPIFTSVNMWSFTSTQHVFHDEA